MKGGILEVFLASAEGLRHTNILGESRNAFWNEKFKFEYPISSWRNLTHLKLKIMEDENLSDPDFVGQTIIHLGGVITEGNARGLLELKPAPFNIVLEDDTYKGEIKIGFKFIPNVEVAVLEKEECDEAQQEEQRQPWMHEKIFNFQRIPWRWLFFFYNRWSSNHLSSQVQE